MMIWCQRYLSPPPQSRDAETKVLLDRLCHVVCNFSSCEEGGIVPPDNIYTKVCKLVHEVINKKYPMYRNHVMVKEGGIFEHHLSVHIPILVLVTAKLVKMICIDMSKAAEMSGTYAVYLYN